MRTWVAALVLAAIPLGLWYARRPQPAPAPPPPLVAEGPAFEITVTKPRASRPLFGLLPDGLFGAPPAVLRFDHTSEDVEYAVVDDRSLVIRAGEWQLVVFADADGALEHGSEMVFPLELGNGRPKLACRPEEEAFGELRAEVDEASGTVGGNFRLLLSGCTNVASGKTPNWPPSPLTVRGQFERLPFTPRGDVP